MKSYGIVSLSVLSLAVKASQETWFDSTFNHTFKIEYPDCESGFLKDNDVCNQSLDPQTRAKALIKDWSLQEKTNNTQNTSPGVARIGLPPYEWWGEALHGVADSPAVQFAKSGEFSHASSFPQPITMGSSFDDELIYKVASVISTEARAFSNFGMASLNFWTPNINPFKDPRWGRGQEVASEDPFHIQRYVYNLLKGLEGDDQYKKIEANCKHYAAYDMEDFEGVDRHHFDAIVNSQDLNEFYLPPFRTCARDFKAGNFMCSYNRVNGVPACASEYLIDKILKEHWNWKGYVSGDCGAIEDIYTGHNYTKTDYEASAAAMNAGVILDCGTVFNSSLTESVKKGLLQESTLDDSLVQLYASLVKLGYFDSADKVPWRSLTWADVNTKHAQQLAYEAAVKGSVLLKNKDSFLPIDKPTSDQKVAVVGPMSMATIELQGNYKGVAPYIVTVAEGAQEYDWDVSQANGTYVSSTNTSGFEEAIKLGESSDIIFFAGGIDNSIESEGLDRENVTWPQNQLDLIGKLSDLGKPIVILKFGGGQVDDTALLSNDNIRSILWAGYPGQDAGKAIFDIITGKASPAGRLSITQYPAEYADQISMTDMTLRPSDSSPGRTYRWYDNALLEFGFGLHYTNFEVNWETEPQNDYEIKNILESCDGQEYPDLCEFDTYKLQVKNTGTATSDYVALLFLKTKNAGEGPYPRKQLISYARANDIAPGEAKMVDLHVEVGSVARYDSKGNMVLYGGDFELQVDIDQNDGPSSKFSLKGDDKVLENFPQPE